MISKPAIPAAEETTCSPGDYRRPYSSCWGAVLAGTITALGLHFFLTTLGVGFGLAPFRAVPDGHPMAIFSPGAATVWSLFAIIALSFGGWVAGRISGCPRNGLARGFLVWSLTLVVTLPLLALGTNLAFGRPLRHHDAGMEISRQAAVFNEHELALAVTQRSVDQLRSFSEEAGQSVPTNAAPKAATRARREVGLAVDKLFAPGNANGFQTNRQEAINALMMYTELNAVDATATMDAWIISRANLQVELNKISAELNQAREARAEAGILIEQQARTDADLVMHCRLRTAKWAFFALLIGLAGATLGGRCGGECAGRKSGSPHANLTSG